MENLIEVLGKECDEYDKLLALSMKKTPVIVSGDLARLQQITDEEQIVVGSISHLERQREEVTKDIANVLNKDVAELKLSHFIYMLGSRPQEQKPLAQAHDRLRSCVDKLRNVNEQNRELLFSALELVDFDMQILQAMRQGPQTANYDKGAYNVGGNIGIGSRGFDAKQ
jgi:flagellar biosynthesis/type III secretory pathway chaperone